MQVAGCGLQDRARATCPNSRNGCTPLTLGLLTLAVRTAACLWLTLTLTLTLTLLRRTCGERRVPAAVDLDRGGKPADVVGGARAW